MIIPPGKLESASLRGIVESFVLREGTDYGGRELNLDEKVNLLLPQVINADVLIVYDQESESINLVPKRDYREEAS